MPLMGPIPEGRSFFCPHCGALYSVTDTRRPNCPCDRRQFMQDLEVQPRLVQDLFVLVYFVRKGFRSGSNLAYATTLGSSLSHNPFLYAADPLRREAASAQRPSPAPPSSEGIFGGDRDLKPVLLGILPASARRSSDQRPCCFLRPGLQPSSLNLVPVIRELAA